MKILLKYKVQKCLFLILFWALGAIFLMGVASLLPSSPPHHQEKPPPVPTTITPPPRNKSYRDIDSSEDNQPKLTEKIIQEEESELVTPGLIQRSRSDSSWLERLHLVEALPHTIYSIDMAMQPSDRDNCVYTKYIELDSQIPICPHSPTDDRYISAQLVKDGTWEPMVMALFIKGLHHYPTSTVIDLGCHVGMYTLVGATLGHQAVGVEPVWSSVVRAHKGAWMGGINHRVQVLYHALAQRHMYMKLRYKPGNLGGTSVEPVELREVHQLKKANPYNVVTSVTLDDLKHYVNTSIVIIKMDIEGWECQAVLGGTNFLSSHFAPYIFMEWSVMSNNRHKYLSPCKKKDIEDMISWLTRRDYEAFITKTATPLHPDKLDSWRAGDIYWKHKTAPALQDPQNFDFIRD